MKISLLLSTFLISIYGLSQEPDIQWQKSLGGSILDIAWSIEQTTDGGYIIAGGSTSNDGDITGNHGDSDYWIVKLDAAGNTAWQKSLGGSGYDFAWSIKQTSNGEYIVAGYSNSNDGDVTGNNGDYDSWIVKLDGSGSILWQKSLGGSGFDEARSIKPTPDGGFIVAGKSESIDGDVTGNNGASDYWIVKLDASGNITWQKSLGGSGFDYAHSINLTNDGGYIVAGASNSNDGDVTGNNGNMDWWIIKLNTSGSITWQKSLGGSLSDHAYSIQQTTDGGYIIAGKSRSNNGNLTINNGADDYWIVKLDASGNITWQKSFGGSGVDEAYSIQQTSDDGYIVAGYSESNDGDVIGSNGYSFYWIIKLNTSGSITWQKAMGGYNFEYAYSIQQTTDGGYIIAGSTNSDDGDITEFYGSSDYWVIKLNPEASSISENKIHEVNLYPNPVTNTFTISFQNTIKSKFKIIDIEGKEVLFGNFHGQKQSIDISQLTKGTYHVVFENSELPTLPVIKED